MGREAEAGENRRLTERRPCTILAGEACAFPTAGKESAETDRFIAGFERLAARSGTALAGGRLTVEAVEHETEAAIAGTPK